MKHDKPATLVILTPGFPENEADTTCIPPQQVFIKALKEVNPGLNIIVLTFQYPFFSKTYHWHDIKVMSFGHPHHNKVFRLVATFRIWLSLRKLHKEYDIIGLLSFWLGKCSFMGSKFAEKYNLKHYSWLLGQDARAGNKYVNKIRPKAESLIAISDYVAAELNKNYKILPKHIIPVGVNTDLFSAENIEKDIDIIGSGSLIPLKQYHIFLEVIKSLSAIFPNIKAVICGDGAEMKKLSAIVKQLGIEHNITLIGRLPHLQVLALMQRSKILLHPSNYEGFSTVCLEALYAGAKVVSFIRPMNLTIENWFIADNQDNMLQILESILKNEQTAYKYAAPYLVQDSATAIINLFKVK